MKKTKGIIVIVLILACLLGLGYYAGTILSATSTNQGNAEGVTSEGGVKLGLDLSGGVSITYQIVDENPSAQDIADTKSKLEERAESYTTEYAVYQ